MLDREKKYLTQCNMRTGEPYKGDRCSLSVDRLGFHSFVDISTLANIRWLLIYVLIMNKEAVRVLFNAAHVLCPSYLSDPIIKLIQLLIGYQRPVQHGTLFYDDKSGEANDVKVLN